METKEGFGLSDGNNSKSLSELIDKETLEKLKQEIKEEVEKIEDTEKLAELMWKFVLLWLLTNDTEKKRAGCGCEPIINPGGDVPITLLDAQTKDLGMAGIIKEMENNV